jgi:hypothetical protein
MNEMNNMKYVKTQFGRVPLEDLPFVQSEQICSKFATLIIFGIVIIIIVMLFNLLFPPHSKQCFISERIPPEFQSSVKAVRTDICIPLASILDKVIFVVKGVNGIGLVSFKRYEMKVLKVKNPNFMILHYIIAAVSRFGLSAVI